MRDTFKEADVEEPNWQTVSSNLELVMYGQVSVTEFYQAWRNPSWEKLSHALEKSHEYHQVAELAKKKAGVCVCACVVHVIFTYVFVAPLHGWIIDANRVIRICHIAAKILPNGL